MKTISLFLLLIIATYNVSAQEVETPTVAKEGTFQFIIQDAKGEPAFTTDILILIEERRLQSEDVVIKLSEKIDIYIPSRNKINAKDYLPLELIQQ